MNDLPPVLTVDDLARLLHVSRRSIYQWQKRRDWPFTPLNLPVLRFSREQVLTALAGGALARLHRKVA